jgi:hypothetical protein
MRGIEQGYVDKKAIDVLSFPDEPKLPIWSLIYFAQVLGDV